MLEVTAELPMLELILQSDADADAHRLQLRMVDVGGNNHPPAGDLVTHQFV